MTAPTETTDERSGSAAPPVPPVLYLPLLRTSSSEEPRVQIRELKDGRLALLAYTALDRLLERCGPNQRWVLVRTPDLGRIKDEQHYDVVILDLEVPAQYRLDGAIG